MKEYRVMCVTTPHAVTYEPGVLLDNRVKPETFDNHVEAEERARYWNNLESSCYGVGFEHFHYYVVAEEIPDDTRHWVQVLETGVIVGQGEDTKTHNRNTVWHEGDTIYASGDSVGEALRRVGEYLEIEKEPITFTGDDSFIKEKK